MKTAIEMAREAGGLGFVHDAGDAPSKWQFTPKELERFAEIVRADEREACAKVCDWYVDYSSNPMNFAENCAQEIRARGSNT